MINQLFKKQKNINYLIFLSFCVYFLIGLSIFKDYDISIDEPFHRTSGFYWYIWLIDNYFPNFENLSNLKIIFKEMRWSNNFLSGEFIQYGIFFDLFSAYFEDILKLHDSNNSYHFRHLFNFLIFFSSSIVFFYFIKERFQNNWTPIISTLFFVTSPRIFAESFYNCKDIIFMSFVIFALFFSLRSLRYYRINDLIIFAFFSAIATNVRIMGIFLIFLFIVFFFMESLERKNFLKEKFHCILLLLFFYIFFTYLLWPYLWFDPIENFLYAFQSFKNYAWGGSILYFGDYVRGSNLPWHYIFSWIGITTPIIYLPLFLIGAIIIFKKFFKNFLKINNSNSNNLWSDDDEKYDLFIFFFFFGPIVAVLIFNSTLYGGWRHLYFIYPALIYLTIYGLDFLIKLKNHKLVQNIFFLLIFISIINNINNIIKFHPYQNVYFNILISKNANKLFEVDYWGLGNARAIKEILIDNKNKNHVGVRTASFSPLHYSQDIINDENVNYLTFSGTVDLGQKYIFTNYIYEKNPTFAKKYFIPKNYHKFFTLKRGDIIINEIYKKKQNY